MKADSGFSGVPICSEHVSVKRQEERVECFFCVMESMQDHMRDITQGFDLRMRKIEMQLMEKQ